MSKNKLELGLKKKSKVAIGVCLTIIAVITLVALRQLSRDIKESIEDSVMMTLSNVTEQRAKIIHKNLTEKQEFLQVLSDDIIDECFKDEESCLRRIAVLGKAYGMDNIGVVYSDGMCHMEDGKVLDLKGSNYITKSFSGQPVITKSCLLDDEKKEYVNVFTMPIENNGSIPLVLIATYISSDFAKSMETESFGGIGNSFVVDREGKAVITSNDYSSNNIVSYICENPDIVADDNGNDYFKFTYEGKNYFACMEKIGVNDWYIFTYVDKPSVFHEANLIQKSVLSLSMVLLAIIIITVIILVSIMVQYQKNIRSVVFEDDLLQEHNYEYLKALFEKFDNDQKKNMFLLVLDIDGFKALNMSYGNEIGNQVLKYISHAFQEVCPEDQIYRRHSDHFAAIMHEGSKELMERRLNQFLKKIQMDIKLRKVVPFTLSLGVCCLDGVEHLYSGYTKAMLAKNSIKGNCVNQYAFFEDHLREISIRNMELCSNFDGALQNGEFKVVYQPKFDMRTREVVGAEALVRWVKPDGKMISPGEFIPCFENSSQIIQLDEYVFKTVCEQMADMKKKNLPVKCISVNLSRVHVKSQRIAERLDKIARQYAITPSDIAVEVTESAISENAENVCGLVNELHRIGFRVDMDDYGTGISSLLSLANADFDVIKLDRSFVNSIGNSKMEDVIKSTIELAKHLNLGVIAEGIETKEQEDFLIKNSCYYAQGYYYSKPVNKEMYELMLQT